MSIITIRVEIAGAAEKAIDVEADIWQEAVEKVESHYAARSVDARVYAVHRLLEEEAHPRGKNVWRRIERGEADGIKLGEPVRLPPIKVEAPQWAWPKTVLDGDLYEPLAGTFFHAADGRWYRIVKHWDMSHEIEAPDPARVAMWTRDGDKNKKGGLWNFIVKQYGLPVKA